jgi:hypothetical protein
MTAKHQIELLAFLQSSEPTPAAKAVLKRTCQQFVLEYGWWYEPVDLPKRITLGTPEQFHTNASNLMLAENSLIYCEGYALFESGMTPTIHAWVTDGRGRAIDNTWSKPGVAYAGVPFKSLFVSMTTLKNHAIISLLGDWQNAYPLRGELGDRPEEWLELRGQGVRRLNVGPHTWGKPHRRSGGINHVIHYDVVGKPSRISCRVAEAKTRSGRSARKLDRERQQLAWPRRTYRR